jgi:hypothetical protein
MFDDDSSLQREAEAQQRAEELAPGQQQTLSQTTPRSDEDGTSESV